MPPGKKRPRVIYLPMDCMSTTARRLYTKPGLIYTYDEEDIKVIDGMTFEQFIETKDPQEAQKLFKQICANNSDTEIAKLWNVSEYQIKRIRNDLNIVKDRSGSIISIGDVKKWGNYTTGRPQIREKKSVREPEKKIVGFKIALDGDFTADQLCERLESIKSIAVVANTSKFQAKIVIEELAEN